MPLLAHAVLQSASASAFVCVPVRLANDEKMLPQTCTETRGFHHPLVFADYATQLTLTLLHVPALSCPLMCLRRATVDDDFFLKRQAYIFGAAARLRRCREPDFRDIA